MIMIALAAFHHMEYKCCADQIKEPPQPGDRCDVPYLMRVESVKLPGRGRVVYSQFGKNRDHKIRHLQLDKVNLEHSGTF